MPESTLPGSHWCILRVYTEANGPVVALILVTHTRTGTDVREIELPYLLWESLGTRAAATLVLQLYRSQQPEAVRRLGHYTVRRRIATSLSLHYQERLLSTSS
ncbi:hypothetical protein GCM10027048_05880 [Hymenobacter coalescens]